MENVYYVGPWSHIIELFTDSTWNSDKAAAGSTLDAYLKQFAKSCYGADSHGAGTEAKFLVPRRYCSLKHHGGYECGRC